MDEKISQQFYQNLDKQGFFHADQTAIVAVSTGVDSMTLLTMLMNLKRDKPHMVVAHMNHELREQSVAEEQYLREFCRQHGLKLEVAHWPKNDHPQKGIEAAAREQRYTFFAKLMNEYQAKFLLTAHHLNDQIETTLMKFVRGGQLHQLLGMQPNRPFGNGLLIRPLLSFTKAELTDYAKEKHVDWFEDVTNQDLTIQRNRFRHQIVPELSAENAQFLHHFEDYQDQLKTVLEIVSQTVTKSYHKVVDPPLLLNVPKFNAVAQNQQKLILQNWLSDHHIQRYPNRLLDEMQQLLLNNGKPQGKVLIGTDYEMVKRYQVASVQERQLSTGVAVLSDTQIAPINQWLTVQDMKIGIFEQPPAQPDTVMTQLWLPPKAFPLQLRLWHANDAIRLKGDQHQKVRRILIDHKVPTEERQTQPVIVTQQDQIIWIVGQKFSWFKRPDDYQTSWKSVLFCTR
ncbi:tRNA lysidine(34) synthetase TilS [Paucilactobacillus sp. N302-9]